MFYGSPLIYDTAITVSALQYHNQVVVRIKWATYAFGLKSTKQNQIQSINILSFSLEIHYSSNNLRV